MSILGLQVSWWEREGWLLCFTCLSHVLLLFMLCGSSSRCLGLVCGVWLWYFLITYFLTNPLFSPSHYTLSSHIVLVLINKRVYVTLRQRIMVLWLYFINRCANIKQIWIDKYIYSYTHRGFTMVHLGVINSGRDIAIIWRRRSMCVICDKQVTSIVIFFYYYLLHIKPR